MEKLTEQQVIDRVLLVKEPEISLGDVLSVKEHPGGLVNYVFKVETKKGDFYLKQFLPELKSDFFKGLELGPGDRIKLSYDVTNMFERILGKDSNIIPHIYAYDEKEGYMIMKGFDGAHSLINDIKLGIFSDSGITDLAKSIAAIHQESFSLDNNRTDLYNLEWLKLKLKYQYYEMAKLLDVSLARKLTEFTDNYQKTKKVLVHGDLCSINILLDDKSRLHLIDFEDAHIGTPSFDLGYLLSEYFIARLNFPEKAEVIKNIMNMFLNNYFKIFNRIDREEAEKEATIHAASMILYRTFGLSKNAFTGYINESIKSQIKMMAENMIKNSNSIISKFI